MTSRELIEKTMEVMKANQERDALEGKLKGAGDVIAKVLKTIGIKPCEECKKRQERLNKLIPF